MYGFERSKTILEFEKIVTHIATFCVSETAKKRLLNSTPFMNPAILEEVLWQIQDLREVYLFEGGLPITDFYDIRVLLAKIEPEQSYLDIKDLAHIQNFLETISGLHRFHKKLGHKYLYLQKLTQSIIVDEPLLNQLKFTIEPSGRIFDNASKELKLIRKEIALVDQEIHQRLERILRKKVEFIQEEYITLRDGRFVVPVREFSVNKIPGIVHGQSGSGSTYFVEPLAVVEFNNQLQKLLGAEHKEIVNILKRLSGLVREDRQLLLANFEVLNELDTLQAKARYANENKCTKPLLSKSFSMQLTQAKHPLLLKMHPETTVPLNITVGAEYHEVIISGPNAGGKTVALKTIGLLQLLFQCGFHIPVNEGSCLPLCQQIFTVIGDEQSIENDLSTFSSHIQALHEMINKIKEGSLVLIDEVGRGTDPEGGAALAIAFLEELNRPGVISIVTTHQNQLKSFAAETKGVVNAAMQFNLQKLAPLFVLEMGIPGSSYTFEICKRFGLEESLVRRAVQISGEESYQLDKLLADVIEKSRRYQELNNKLSIKESELNSLVNLYTEQAETLKKRQKKFEKEAAAKAKEILDNLNKEIEAVIREIRESKADKLVIKQGRDRLEERKKEIEALLEEEKVAKSIDIRTLKTGLRVHSKQYGLNGVISKIISNRNEVEIDKEGIKIIVPLSDLERMDEHGQPIKTEDDLSMIPSLNIPNELDLRGLLVEEAIRELETYLDFAVHSDWEEVRLVHGKGTGSLRMAVHQYLSGLKSIKAYRLGKWGEGDTGVTIVKLK